MRMLACVLGERVLLGGVGEISSCEGVALVVRDLIVLQRRRGEVLRLRFWTKSAHRCFLRLQISAFISLFREERCSESEGDGLGQREILWRRAFLFDIRAEISEVREGLCDFLRPEGMVCLAALTISFLMKALARSIGG